MVLQILSEDGQRWMQAVFLEAEQMMIGAPLSGIHGPAGLPGAFAPINDALRNNVFGYLYSQIIPILGIEGIHVGPDLAQAIETFAWEKTHELEENASTKRLGAVMKQDEREDKTLDARLDNSWRGVFGRRLRKKGGQRIKTIGFSLFLVIIGILISAVVGNQWFLWAFLCLAFNMVLPDPGETKLHENLTGWGTLMDRDSGNRVNSGLALFKAITKLLFMMFILIGLSSTTFPISNLLLLFLSFGFYFSLPVEFEPTKPHDFILSFWRVIIALYIAIFIFGLSRGSGIFHAGELGWLTLAFFLVLPVATEKKNIARALGALGKGSGQAHDTIHTVIFLGTMIIFFASYAGLNLLSGDISGGMSAIFQGTGGIVFGAVWIIGLVAGLTTPAETRPWMGIMVLIVGFVVFGIGVGQQAMGVAFFGQWWPTVHNTATEFLKPIGGLFDNFQMTFGQSWLLFTNPIGYAQQITQGTYAQNQLGAEGAYGLEIRKFDVQSIYIDEPFMINIELENKGMYHAKNIRVEILTSINGFKIGRDPTLAPATLIPQSANPTGDEKKQLGIVADLDKVWYRWEINNANSPRFNLLDIEPKDIIPIFVYGYISCEDFRNNAQKDWGSLGKEVRSKFIPFYVKITYAYESESNLQIDFISVDEWKRLSTEGKLNRAPILSLISTSPASLNLGAMDQPIGENLPFYVGFNLTSTWAKNTFITLSDITLKIPSDFVLYNNRVMCTTPPHTVSTITGYEQYKFRFASDKPPSSVCSFKRVQSNPLNVPKKTYTIVADASYQFSKWEEKDTQFNFKDVCWPMKTP